MQTWGGEEGKRIHKFYRRYKYMALLAIPMGARQGLFHVPRRARHARTEYVVNPAAA